MTQSQSQVSVGWLDSQSSMAIESVVTPVSESGIFHMRWCRFSCSLFLLWSLVLATSALAVSKKDVQALPPHYRDWMTKEVNYIITEEESEAFVHLSTDAERDNFIQR